MVLLFPTAAQHVTNADYYQRDKEVVITYDLDKQADIFVYISFDGGRTYNVQLTKVAGDVGKKVTPGRKSLTWYALAENDKVVGDKIAFRVIAVPNGADSKPSKVVRNSYKETLSDYYLWNGKLDITLVRATFYPYPLGISADILAFRYKIIELSLVNFRWDMKEGYLAYEPKLSLYLPVHEKWALIAGIGPSVKFSLDNIVVDPDLWFVADLGVRWGFSKFWSADIHAGYHHDFFVGASLLLHIPL